MLLHYKALHILSQNTTGVNFFPQYHSSFSLSDAAAVESEEFSSTDVAGRLAFSRKAADSAAYLHFFRITAPYL